MSQFHRLTVWQLTEWYIIFIYFSCFEKFFSTSTSLFCVTCQVPLSSRWVRGGRRAPQHVRWTWPSLGSPSLLGESAGRRQTSGAGGRSWSPYKAKGWRVVGDNLTPPPPPSGLWKRTSDKSQILTTSAKIRSQPISPRRLLEPALSALKEMFLSLNLVM